MCVGESYGLTPLSLDSLDRSQDAQILVLSWLHPCQYYTKYRHIRYVCNTSRMDEIEIEALLIRHAAAMSVVKERPGIGLLTDVLIPSDAFYRASISEAERRGPGTMARKLALETQEQGERSPSSAPEYTSRRSPQSYSLDDLLVSLR